MGEAARGLGMGHVVALEHHEPVELAPEVQPGPHIGLHLRTVGSE